MTPSGLPNQWTREMTTHEEIMNLERMFWQALMDMDLDVVVSLLDNSSVSVNARGVGFFGPEQYRDMASSGDARVTAFEFFDERVLLPAEGIAIACYKARQTFTDGGESHEMVVYDTTTWIRRGERWVACAHTETPAQTASGTA